MSKPGAFGVSSAGFTVVATGDPDPPGTGAFAIAQYSHGGVVATTLITLTPSGGTPPYTVDWFYVSGDRRITLNLPATDYAFQQWQATVRAFDSFNATWEWIMRDARGRSVTGGVFVSFESNS